MEAHMRTGESACSAKVLVLPTHNKKEDRNCYQEIAMVAHK